MPDEPRRVYITLGKKSYSILTRLDEKHFARVVRIAKESMEGIDSSNEQEERLLLACFKLAFAIESAEGRVRQIIEESEPS